VFIHGRMIASGGGIIASGGRFIALLSATHARDRHAATALRTISWPGLT
jgi:hypothetical protein